MKHTKIHLLTGKMALFCTKFYSFDRNLFLEYEFSDQRFGPVYWSPFFTKIDNIPVVFQLIFILISLNDAKML